MTNPPTPPEPVMKQGTSKGIATLSFSAILSVGIVTTVSFILSFFAL